MDPSPSQIKTGTEAFGEPLIIICLKKILMS